ncbi:MAG: hypothetical protein ACLQIB_40745 [Isosphaeraceae bacterium]
MALIATVMYLALNFSYGLGSGAKLFASLPWLVLAVLAYRHRADVGSGVVALLAGLGLAVWGLIELKEVFSRPAGWTAKALTPFIIPFGQILGLGLAAGLAEVLRPAVKGNRLPHKTSPDPGPAPDRRRD